jgi:hypothetical protein
MSKPRWEDEVLIGCEPLPLDLSTSIQEVIDLTTVRIMIICELNEDGSVMTPLYLSLCECTDERARAKLMTSPLTCEGPAGDEGWYWGPSVPVVGRYALSVSPDDCEHLRTGAELFDDEP